MFLPGLLCTCDLFSYQVSHLPNGFRAACAEIPPAGRASSIARSLIGSIREPSILCGLSFGGILAMEIVRQRPDLVSGLILMDTNALSESEEVSRNRYDLVSRAGELGTGRMSAEYLMDSLVHPDHVEDQDMVKLVWKMADRVGSETYALHADALAGRRDYSRVLKGFRKPAMIIYGEQDRLTPKPRQDHLASLLPSAKVDVIPHCGHLSSVEQPYLVSEAINLWLEEEFS